MHPQPETYWGNVNPIGPRGVYDEAKRYAEALTMTYHQQQGVDTCIARIFNTYGPRMRKNDGRASVNFIHQALEGKPLTVYGDGSQTRSLCYVDDLIRGLVMLAMSNEHLPVVCLPGLSRNARDFHQLALLLADHPEKSRRVIAVDYRGRGLSQYDPNPVNYNVMVECRDVIALCDLLGLKHCLFIGTSRGGLILHILAALRPDLIAAAMAG